MNQITEQVYYIEPYAQTLNAHVVKVREDGIVLDRTIFYPEGGGQEGDRGFINGVRVLDTRLTDGQIVHIMETTEPFREGYEVETVLDWPHRWHFMKAHTAQHMISGTMYTKAGINTVAVHMSDEIITVETDRGDIPLETLYQIESAVNEEIINNREVSSLEVSHSEAESLGLRRSIKVSGDVRLVQIGNVDLIACGGIHVRRTGEIGRISYAGSEIVRSHVRTIWYYSSSAVSHQREDREVVNEAGVLLSSRGRNIIPALEHLIQENRNLKAEVRSREEMIASLVLADGKKVFSSPVELSAYHKLCSEGRVFFAVYEREGGVNWLLCASDGLFSRFREKLFPLYAMKGGGKGIMYQGSASCSADELLSAAQVIIMESERNG